MSEKTNHKIPIQGNKLNINAVLIGIIVFHIFLNLIFTWAFKTEVFSIENATLYISEYISAALLIGFAFVLLSKSWGEVILYSAIYYLTGYIYFFINASLSSYAVSSISMNIIIGTATLCGMVLVFRAVADEQISSISSKNLLLMTLLGAFITLFISPGLSFSSKTLYWEVPAIFITTFLAWIINRQYGHKFSMQDAGQCAFVLTIGPLLKNFILFILLGMIGIDTRDWVEGTIFTNGINLLISMFLIYMIFEFVIKTARETATGMNRAINRTPTLNPDAYTNLDPVVAKKILTLIQAMQSNDLETRGTAVAALAEYNLPIVNKILQDVYETAPDMYSRMLAMNILEKRGVSLNNAEGGTGRSENIPLATTAPNNRQSKLDQYVDQLVQLRKQNPAPTSFFLGANQPANLDAIGQKIADQFGCSGLEYVTKKIGAVFKTEHPYDGRELEAAWEDIWMEQKMKGE